MNFDSEEIIDVNFFKIQEDFSYQNDINIYDKYGSKCASPAAVSRTLAVSAMLNFVIGNRTILYSATAIWFGLASIIMTACRTRYQLALARVGRWRHKGCHAHVHDGKALLAPTQQETAAILKFLAREGGGGISSHASNQNSLFRHIYDSATKPTPTIYFMLANQMND